MRTRASPSVAVCAALVLAGCAAGPDFKRPAAPAANAYLPGALPAQTQPTDTPGGGAQAFALGRDLPGEWWALFGSAKLNDLIKEAMANHPSIAAQQAALRAARADLRAGEGAFFPQVQGTLNAERAKESGASIGPGFPGFIFNVFQATVGVSYTFDLFGGERRTVEQLRARVEEQNYLLEGSYLTLTANVATTAVQIASLTEQIAATEEIIELEQAQLTFIERQYALGTRTRADVLQQQSALATARATLPALRQQLAAAGHGLATLTGRLPQDAPPLSLTLGELTLPGTVPVSLPSALVEQRPDIRAHEAALHEASAAVGIATSNMLPQLTLTGGQGGEALSAGSVFTPAGAVWNVAGGLTQPIFAGGTLLARRHSAIAAFDQAGAQYRLTVLNAFQNVADTLTALENDALALSAENDAVTSAKASLELIKRQYDAGAVNYVSLLTAQQIYQQSRLAYVQAVASRYTDTITLFQALGGGWWNRTDAGAQHSGR